MNRSVAITGAAGGMGRAAAERLAAHGWRVTAVDIDASKLAWAEGQDTIRALAADVATEDGNARMVEAARAHGDRLNAVILNAAVNQSGSIDQVPIEAFDRLIAINLRGPVLGVRAALPELRKASEPAILFTSSTHGLTGDAGSWAYSATKHAIIGVMRALARELGPQGIRVNAICPGATRGTGMSDMVEQEMPEMYRRVAESVPLRRWAEASEMAAVMEFLISPEASFVNGLAMAVDGGAMVGAGMSGA